MKNSVVRKTFLDGLLNMLLPYYCRGCGRTGELLCEDCRRKLKTGQVKSMKKEELGVIENLYIVGFREGVLKRLVEDYKFKSVKKIAVVLAEMLDEVLPQNLEKVAIVPLPTVRKHIRERGFDHTKYLAAQLGTRRKWPVEPVLLRVNKAVQVGADEETRKRQAERAYAVDKDRLPADVTYLLLDDVWTTGASMRAAAQKLHEAGAKQILGAVIEVGK